MYINRRAELQEASTGASILVFTHKLGLELQRGTGMDHRSHPRCGHGQEVPIEVGPVSSQTEGGEVARHWQPGVLSVPALTLHQEKIKTVCAT